jgi:hypothetical protein
LLLGYLLSAKSRHWLPGHLAQRLMNIIVEQQASLVKAQRRALVI